MDPFAHPAGFILSERMEESYHQVPVVGREGTQVGSVPRIVERVPSVARVAADLEFVLLPFRVQFEAGIFGEPATFQNGCRSFG